MLRAPVGSRTRPTSDRVREAMFSILTSMDAVEGARVLDLFAGSGALGIEALSRGAEAVTFVDSDGAALDAIRVNLAVVGHDAARATVVRADVMRWIDTSSPVDLVLADPPYAFDRWAELLRLLEGRTQLIVAETASPWDPGPGWETVKQKRYGGTVVSVAHGLPVVPSAVRCQVNQEGDS